MEKQAEHRVLTAAQERRVRRSVSLNLQGALIERGLWTDVRQQLAATHPDVLQEIEATDSQEWLRIGAHLRLLDAVADVLGLEGIKQLGRERIRGIKTGSFFPEIVGSWTRSFQNGGELVQVFPHLWKASGDNNGELVLRELGTNHALFRFENNAREVCESAPWRATAEGMALGLLDRANLRGASRATLVENGNAVDFEITWITK